MTFIGSRAPGALLPALVCTVTAGSAGVLGAGLPTRAGNVIEEVPAGIRLLAGEGSFGLVMGGTGNPTPDTPYFDAMVHDYLSSLFPGIPANDTGYHALPTPEQFCPFVCLAPGTAPGGTPPFPLPPPLNPDDYPPNLTFGSSATTGAGIMNQAIRHDIGTLADGHQIAVSGYSQSGTVATLSLQDLIANAGKTTDGLAWPTATELGNVHYELTGDPNSPIGGILDRFQFPDSVGKFFGPPEMQHVPFVNIPLGIAPTPTDDFGASTIITGEYDGWADEPQDPVTGLLALINALAGIATVHPFYPDYSGVLDQSGQLASVVDVGTIGNTTFDFIPEQLPLLQFMYNGSTTAGQFFGDFFSPWLRLGIDWAYGNAGDPGDNLTATLGHNNAGGAGADGLFAISPDQVTNGANIAGSPYEASVGVAGGPWAATLFGDLWAGADPTDSSTVASSGIAGIFEKMDPLQILAGIDNAAIQSIVGPWADVFAGDSATLPAGELDVVDDITQALRFVSGYDLLNSIDQGLLDLVKDLGPDAQHLVNDALDGPLIAGQPIIDLVGGVFDIFNVFGA